MQIMRVYLLKQRYKFFWGFLSMNQKVIKEDKREKKIYVYAIPEFSI